MSVFTWPLPISTKNGLDSLGSFVMRFGPKNLALCLSRKSIGWKISHFRAGFRLIFISCFVYSLIVAPYPNFLTKLNTIFFRSYQEGVHSIILHTIKNVYRFFNYSDHSLWVMLRAQLLFTIIIGCGILWKQHKDRLATQYVIKENCSGSSSSRDY